MSSKKTAPEPVEETAEQTKGEQTRARLLEAAYKLFLQQGFHGTSMRQIAEQAELAVGGIYNHFTDKEEIFAAVLDAYHPYHVLFPVLEETQGETVEAFMRDVAQRLKSGVDGVEAKLLPLVFMDLVEFQGRHIRQLTEKLLPIMLGFFQRFSQRSGRLRAIPTPVMLRTFMGMFVGYLLSEMLLKNAPLFKQEGVDWFDGMVDIYLHGILADGGQAEGQ